MPADERRYSGLVAAQIPSCRCDVDDQDQARVVDLFVDTAGLMIAGSISTPARALAAPPAATGSIFDVVWRHGVAVHAMDFDDTHESSLCHTCAPIASAVISLAVARRLPGRGVIDAYAAGVRLVDFLAPLGPQLNEKGIHSTAILGAVGAALASAVVIDSDPETAAVAVELAATMAGGLCTSFGSDAKLLQAGRAGVVGVRSALLAQAGMRAPAGSLLGERGLISMLLGAEARERLPDPGPRTEAITGVAIKAYPACFLTHAAIDVALELRDKLRINSADQVTAASLTVHPIVTTLADKSDLTSDSDSRFSVRYGIFAALTAGRPGLQTYSGDGRERILGDGSGWSDFSRQITIHTDPDTSRIGARLELETADGRRAEAARVTPNGAPEHPLTSEAVSQKFLSNAETVMTSEAARRMLAQLRELSTVTDVRQILNTLVAL